MLLRREWYAGIAVASVFIFVAYGAHQYAEVLREHAFFAGGWGMLEYIGITVLAVVIAPVSTIPLLPVASVLWGPFIAAVLSIIGWGLGAILAFEVARGFARPYLVKHFNMSRLERYAYTSFGKDIRTQFLTLVLLRMCVPVDVLSYAIGLTFSMKRSVYISATFVGIAPFAFIFSYAAMLSPMYQS